MGPVVDHPGVPGAVAVMGPGGSLSPPVHPEAMTSLHPAGMAVYHEEKKRLEADAKETLVRKVEKLETTQLAPAHEPGFQKWIEKNRIRDLDHSDSHYDYRGAYLAGQGRAAGGHFTDQFKQHGHPTFSEESKYSGGTGDGGTWDGEKFRPGYSRASGAGAPVAVPAISATTGSDSQAAAEGAGGAPAATPMQQKGLAQANFEMNPIGALLGQKPEGAAPTPAPPPASSQGVGGAPGAYPQQQAAAAAQAAQPAPQPEAIDPKAVVTSGGGSGARPGENLKEWQARLLAEAAREKLRGSPGYLQRGGTFETGSTVQRSGMPSPETAGRQMEMMSDNPTIAGPTAGGGEAPDRIVGQDANGEPIWGPGEQTQDYDTPVNRGAADHRRGVIDVNRAENAETSIAERREAQAIAAGQSRQTEDMKRAHLDQAEADIRGMANKIASQEVDPNRLWKEKSTGQKIAAIGFMMLGSGGDATNHSPGATMKAYEKIVDNDIAAQQASIDNKKHAAGLYEHLFQIGLQKFGSREAGDAMRKQAMYESIDLQLAQQEAQASTAKQQLLVRETRTMTQQKIAEYRGQLEASAMGSKSTNFQTVGDKYIGGKAPDVIGAAKLLGEASDAAKASGGSTENTFRLGNRQVEFRAGLTPPEMKEARTTAYNLEEAKRRLSQIEKSQQDFGDKWIFSKTGAALVRDYLTAKSQADHEGVTRNDDVEFGMKNLVGMNSTEAREYLRSSLAGTERTLFDHYGLRVAPPAGASGNLDSSLAAGFHKSLEPHAPAMAGPRAAVANGGQRQTKEQQQTSATAAAYGVSPEVAAFLQPPPAKKKAKK